MLAGQLPFKSDYDHAVVYAVLNEPAEPITRLRPDAPKELERIVAGALEKAPAKRYQSAEELLADLRSAKRSTSKNAMEKGTGQLRRAGSVGRRRILWLAPVVVFLAGALYGVLNRFEFTAKGPPDSGRKMIAVLPFENLGSSEDDYFAAGMTEEITSRLAAVEDLGVISRTSVVQYDRTGKTIRQIGEDLGVDFILEGTVRWDHRPDRFSRIRITPQLIRVNDGTHLWANNYEHELVDVFAVQAEIAKKIIEQLGVTLLDRQRSRLEARPTDNLDAYQAYLRGVDYRQHMAFSDENKLLAEKMFARAVELDSNFALAHAELSIVLSYMYYGRGGSTDRMTAAKASWEKALSLDPDLPEAHLARAAYLYRCLGDFDSALEQIETAGRIRPNDPRVLSYRASALNLMGDFEGSLQARLQAVELDPLNADLLMEIAYLHMLFREYDQADRFWDRCLALAPEYSGTYEIKAKNCWLWHGDARKARAVLDRMPETPQSTDPLWVFGNMYTQELYERDYEAAVARTVSLPIQGDIYDGDLYEQKPISHFLGLVYYLMGDSVSAKEHFEVARAQLEAEIERRPDNSRFHSALGIACAALGRGGDAIREGELGVELSSHDHPYTRGTRVEDLAFIYVLTGDYDAAFDRIEQVLSTPAFFSVGLLTLDPKWDPLRRHPRYAEIVAKYSRG
jgi:TolB-like protein/Flp pilus assembly protein TadD